MILRQTGQAISNDSLFYSVLSVVVGGRVKMPDSEELLAPVQPILMFLFAEKHNCYFKIINYSQKEIKISLVWGCFP